MICFTEDEAFVILWAIGHAREAAAANDAVSVIEAHRRAGLPHDLGGPLLQAIYDGEIPSEPSAESRPVRPATSR